ncbi:potassium voltage-gated channel, KQT-like subfamily, member [Seminavis robusta]|uniref:Potassium voltage-gated channel, KQT-like subfamily, member n=1 Tax=Seminavis robusta TaxID=568900 RepID=A0A9N8HBJ9_9STRA|nr:potassium voltage-gated channel, KQT-like subfamily, member [Seminavis robusta]|eukprot:Sro365_g127450.1 potassium voltage-gated channel, KQT-like subfamily, member (548) ;mRNA; r:63856-65766
MYGSVARSSAAMGTDPLLPSREPSTAESRRLRKRTSRKLVPSGRGVSRRQLLAMQQSEQEVKPVMKSLFRRSSTRSKNKPHAAPRISAVGMDIETLHDEVTPANAMTPLKEAAPTGKEKQTSKDQVTATMAANPPSKKANGNKKKNHKHSWLYVLLHPSSTHPHAILYKNFISFIIVVDVAFFAASTEEKWNLAYPELFYTEEGLASAIFMIEYLCRLAVAPESHKYANQSPWQARFHYVRTVPALMDAAAAFPFFLELPTGFSLPNLTWIRFFRLVRILRTESYARSMDAVWRVIYYNSEILSVALYICILLVLITSILMYYLRPQDPHDAEDFSSIMATMYLSVLMLTGQGQPEGDLPWYTKMVVLTTGFFSVAMFAIPASMLTWGFEAEAERCARKARQKYVALLQQETGGDDPENDNHSYSHYISSSSSDDGDTTDEEYLDIIAGGEEDGDGNGEPREDVVKQLIRTFQTCDTDASGSLSMDEFLALMTDTSAVSHHLTMVGMATSMGLMAKRVHHLEAELEKSHQKLDQILQSVQQHQKHAY